MIVESVDSDNAAESVEVQIKLALITIADGSLLVAMQTGASARLPGQHPDRQESLDSSARSSLQGLVGSDSGYLEQLYTFSFGRNQRREIVVSYLALVPNSPELAADCRWQRVSDARARLDGSDLTVLDYALVRLRGKIGYTTIAFHLMAESFALSDLQHLYETILDRPLDPRNFRRRIISSGLVQAENRQRRAGSHRPAALYRFAGNHDPASYLTPASLDTASGKVTDMARDTQ